MSFKSYAKEALTRLFVRQIRRIIKVHKPKVVAVVGSVGKTSTKFAIATVLSETFRVQVQAGNYNTPISVPFIFLGRDLPSLKNPFGWLGAWFAAKKIIYGAFPFDVVVIEIGTDKPGDIIEFKGLVEPDIAVITAVSDEHMEFFGTLDAVAKDELSVSEFSKKLVLNTDDIAPQFIDSYLKKNVPFVTYGFSANDYVLHAKQLTGGYIFELKLPNGSQVKTSVSLIAKHSVKAAAAAAVVADLLGIPPQIVETGVKKILPPPGRMQILKGIKNSTIIDDSYNASPLAVKAALSTLYECQAPQRIALLGMMNELGAQSQESHEEIGKLCNPKKLDLLVTLGADANAHIAQIAELNGCTVLRAKSPYEAGGMIADSLKDGGIILVKGSQNGVFSEEAIKELLADPSDVTRLVRQSDFWLAKKRAQFTDAK